jgi:hypothetical protein
MFGLRILVTAVWVLAQVTQSSVPGSSDDRSVFVAVLAGELRVEVDRMAKGAGLKTPAPIVVFDRTLAMCRTAVPPTRPIGCLQEEQVRRLVDSESRGGPLFAGLVSQQNRQVRRHRLAATRA